MVQLSAQKFKAPGGKVMQNNLTQAPITGMTSSQFAKRRQDVKYNPIQPFRPAEYVEKYLVTSILEGTYPIGAALPNERTLAVQLGVTRPTLRETLRRLASEGWITIHHGKPTIVNDYWQEGGLGLLSTLARYADFLPNGFITHLLEVRLAMLPPLAGRAATYHPQIILNYLKSAQNLTEDAQAFSKFDWKLQMLMARKSQNPVFSLIFNDFASIFKNMAIIYFSNKSARRASREFYRELGKAIKSDKGTVEKTVEKAMERSISIWREVNPRQKDQVFK
jgi:GntR family negative regulator for fad regulon and positive regulator of fabA